MKRRSGKQPDRRSPPRTARDRDQLELIDAMRESNQKLREALVEVFACADGRTLVAFGQILGFVARGSR
ncbi:MAG TPA: hypothetical protein VN253_24930 [Kofleriaceae bacterium]|nr:hypothetical protein [Kofleriaceae bacterium]